MKSNTLIWFSLLVTVLIMSSLYIVHHGWFRPPSVVKTDTVTTTRTDTLWKTDTFTVREPVPKVITKVRTDTVYDSKGNEIELRTENKTYQDTIACAGDTMVVTSYIRGVSAHLDSISVRSKKSEVIKTNTIEVTKYVERPRRLWDRVHIQPQVGAGYGFIHRKPDIYVGIGVGIDL